MTPSRAAKRLTIVIPALNEQDKIADTIDGVLPLARELLDDFEIFLIDDGSTDATGAIMDEFAAGEPRIVVQHNAEPRGVGASNTRCRVRNSMPSRSFPAITPSRTRVLPGCSRRRAPPTSSSPIATTSRTARSTARCSRIRCGSS
ncbi:glycosyltransferase [Bradyrhizobium ottawaense]|uniref:glycosyltransferase family 2 protein n=1 Tax=Bradyrhizobium ottawaense TaxID=931866 RepID=UPI00313DE46D